MNWRVKGVIAAFSDFCVEFHQQDDRRGTFTNRVFSPRPIEPLGVRTKYEGEKTFQTPVGKSRSKKAIPLL